MAFGSPTFLNRYNDVNRRVVVFEFAGPASYATGGVAFSPSEIGLSSIESLELLGARTTSTGVGAIKSAAYSPGATPGTTDKLILGTGPGVEETAATNLSTTTYRCMAVGL